MGELLQLFSTPVIVEDLTDAAVINDVLAPTILARRASDEGVNQSNRGGWHSKRDFRNWAGEPGERLIAQALSLANAHTASRTREAIRWHVDAWANVNGRGGYNVPHTHGGTFWSAVYYVQIDEQVGGGELALHDPRLPALRMHAPNLRFRNCGAEGRAKIIPRAGRMVLFPGWLSHSVEPWDGDSERISVAMNLRAVAGISS